MAYKINGTTVVDNSRNVCACCVTSCCITASSRMDAPSGTTAQRPSSPATGSIYFDTDEGSLVSYNGTEWSSVGGSSAPDPDAPNTLANDDILIGYAESRDSDRCRGDCGSNRYFCNCFNTRQISPCAMWMHGCFNYCCTTDCVRCRACTFLSTHLVCSESAYTCPGCGCVFNQRTGTCSQPLPRVYPDGSVQLMTGHDIPSCCFNYKAARFKDYFLNKFGGMQQHTGYMPLGICNQAGYCVQTTTECAASQVFSKVFDHGLCNPSLNTRGPTCQTFKTGTCTTPFVYGCPQWVYEIKGDIKNLNNPIEVCCITFPFCRLTATTSVQSGYNRFTKSRRAVSGFQPLSGCLIRQLDMSNNCTNFSNCYCGSSTPMAHNLVSKCLTWDYTNPDSYTKNLWTLTNGICVYTTTENITNSWVISRNVSSCGSGSVYTKGWHGPFTNESYFCQACNGVSFITNDGCRLIHMYANQYLACIKCIFQKTTVGVNCCCTQHCIATVPAVEIIDLVNGCVECSVYFCRICDGCRGATTAPECETCNSDPSLNSFQSAGPMFHCGFKPQRVTQTYNGIALGDEFADGSGGSVIKSCSCAGHFYVLGHCCCGRIGFGKFNLCDMKWEYFKGICHFELNTSCACCLRREFRCAVCGTCTSTRHQCLCNWMCTCFEACTGLCYRNTSDGCSFFETFFNTGHNDNLFDCEHRFYDLDLKNMDSVYINPYTEHLVRLVGFGTNCSFNTFYNWIGAICYDLKNKFCISAVDTIFPNEGDKCFMSLTCSLCCWCDSTFTYCCRGNARGLQCKIRFNTCCPAFNMTPYATAGSTTGSGVVISMLAGDQGHGHQLFSSCRLCSACPSPYGGYCCGSYLGYFGPCCYGGDIFCNAGCNGCGAGLNAWRVMYSLAKIPHCTPIGCSRYASRDAAMKYFIETMHGCTDLACAWQCCVDSNILAWRQSVIGRFFYGGTMDTVDITCQYSLGCTNVWTWGQCFCSGIRWVISNTCDLYVCFCSCFCNCYTSYGCGNYCMRYCDLFTIDRCSCLLCGYPCYTAGTNLSCVNSYACKACNDPTSMPIVLKGTSASTLTGGGSDASVLSRGTASYDNLNFYDDTIINYCSNINPKPASNDRQNGWVNHRSTTCFTGANGMLHEWFNKNYACIC